ncbi:type II secretion system protein GspL [Glaciimonas sp. GG7]
MSTLFIRLPARASFNTISSMPDCRFALLSGKGRIRRSGSKQLSGLGEDIAAAERVVLLFAAVDVTLLRMAVPPLSDARLKLALPHLVEEQLLVDPQDCVIVAAPKPKRKESAADHLRLIAVIQRDWLTVLLATVRALGGRHVQAVPAQLCLPLTPSGMAVAVTDHNGHTDIAVRSAAEEGIGWLSDQARAQEVLTGIQAMLPQQPVTPLTLYVAESSVTTYTEVHADNVRVLADDWSMWIAGAQALLSSGGMDLTQGLAASAAGTGLNWHRWRWPLGLVAALLLVNIVSLNLDWWSMRQEASGYRSGMIERYRRAYPNETVIIDPIAQMQQKINAGRDNGVIAADDFIALAANVGESWSALPQSANHAAIAALEYSDRTLLVRFKNAADTDAAEAHLQKTLVHKRLTLSKPSATALQIGRSQ